MLALKTLVFSATVKYFFNNSLSFIDERELLKKDTFTALTKLKKPIRIFTRWHK